MNCAQVGSDGWAPLRKRQMESIVKATAALLGALALVAMAGCAGHPPYVVQEAVGPLRVRPPHEGELVVYSATYVSTNEQSEYPTHTDYTLSDESGARLRQVANHSGDFGSDPARVRLPAGRYQVKALVSGGGYVVVPVIIEAGKKTIIDLDGTALPQNLPADNDVVRLPDGHVVGWRAGAPD